MTLPNNSDMQYLATPKRSIIVRVVLLLLAIGCAGAAVTLAFMHGREAAESGNGGGGAAAATLPGAGPPADSGRVSIGIAYGTEKRTWLEQAAKDFAALPQGRNIDINLIPLGAPGGRPEDLGKGHHDQRLVAGQRFVRGYVRLGMAEPLRQQSDSQAGAALR